MGRRKAFRQPSIVTRKELRKQKREKKKMKRIEHYNKKNRHADLDHTVHTDLITRPGQFVRLKGPITAKDGEPLFAKTNKVKTKKESPTMYDVLNRERKKEKAESERLKEEMSKQRKEMLVKANEEEDKIIKKLEKQLGLNKIKKKQKLFSEDGLDYLLEICDKSNQEQIVAAEKQLANADGESDFEEDLATVTGKDLKRHKRGKHTAKKENQIIDNNNSDFEDNNDLDDINEDSDDASDFDEHVGRSDNDEGDKDSKSDGSHSEISDDEIDNTHEDNDNVMEFDDRFSENDNSDVSDEKDVPHKDEKTELEQTHYAVNTENNEVWEDIYGRKRDKEGNIIKEEKGVYVPPHLRNKESGSEKELAILRRQIKSVLNKLTGTNLHWACTSIENLYSDHSRNSVNSALSDLWVDATIQYALTKDRMMAEHAALVSVLHANVGMEVAAHFLEILATKFDMMMLENNAVEDKKLDNLVAAFSHLYSFKIFQAPLLYDILRCLLDELTEKNIECVLVALRCVGGVLRKEEPLALKMFIQETQSKVSKLSEDVDRGSRIKFLLEVLMAVKNNNLNKIPNYDPSYSEQLKKLTKSVIRRGNYVTPLNISLEDLLKAKERGKWWVVGSAWQGSNVRDAKANDNVKKTVANFDQKLLDLARQQRMNTDIRRSIFCIIMSAEDYMDAFEKLQHLGLKGQQEREIVHVLMACCLQEKKYNPYYAILGQKFCDFERKYQLSIQYAVWDKIKELETLSKHAIGNLAQFLTHLFIEKGLPLSVLKVIEFSDLNKKTVKFMRQILLAVIMNADQKVMLEVFRRVSVSSKLHMFRESLRLFIQHFLIRNAGNKTNVLSDEEMALLKERALDVDKVLTMHESKLKL